MANKRPLIFGGFEDMETESESPLDSIPLPNIDTSLVANLAADTAEAVRDIVKDIFGITEKKGEQFASKGEIKDFQKGPSSAEEGKKKAEAQLAQARIQVVTQEEIIVSQKEQMKKQKEEIRIVESGLSGEEKRSLLHVSLDYSDKHINTPYHMVNLRQKLKEEEEKKKQEEDAQKSQDIPRAGGINMNKVSEGGQAQLSTTGGGGIG